MVAARHFVPAVANQSTRNSFAFYVSTVDTKKHSRKWDKLNNKHNARKHPYTHT